MRFAAAFPAVRLKFFEGSRCVQEEHFVLACAPPWVAGSYWCLHMRTEKKLTGLRGQDTRLSFFAKLFGYSTEELRSLSAGLGKVRVR